MQNKVNNGLPDLESSCLGERRYLIVVLPPAIAGTLKVKRYLSCVENIIEKIPVATRHTWNMGLTK
jgi:hypothetical protein